MTHDRRNGVTLLLVLGLMAMFAMLVITFMVVTTEARRTAETAAEQVVAAAATPEDDLDRAVLKLLVGGLDNAVGPHGILENLYGHPIGNGGTDPLEDAFDNTVTAWNGFLHAATPVSIRDDLFDSLDADADGGTFARADVIGNVLTVTDVSNANGDAKKLLGKSTFILGYNSRINGSNNRISLTPFMVDLLLGDQAAALRGCRYVINSAPFSGTGAGFAPGTAFGSTALTVTDLQYLGGSGGMELALRPNFRAPETTSYAGEQAYKQYLDECLVLMNPDYTAPDQMNMFLGWYDVNGTTGATIAEVIPSFHRPRLLNGYFSGTVSDLLANRTALRKIVMRPTWVDHPDFSGSNPAVDRATSSSFSDLVTALKNGPWDVDGDGDGIADSIWMDVGLGTTTDSRTGKVYKKLAAILVLDMDGRLNVNTHGNAAHYWSQSPAQLGLDKTQYGAKSDAYGSGVGPAELHLENLVSNFEKLLEGDGTTPGRYGDRYSGTSTSTTYVPGNPDDATDADLLDRFSLLDRLGINPQAYSYSPRPSSGSPVVAGYGGRPLDLWGFYPLAFDPLGNRYFGISDGADLYAVNPYLADPYGGDANDMAFTADELQFLLRSPGDADFMQLPARIRTLLGDNATSQTAWSRYRLTLTTRSSDIPVFSRLGGSIQGPSGGSGETYRSLMRMVYAYTGGDATNCGNFLDRLPPEILRGEKINLNRLTLDQDWTHYPATADNDYRAMLRKKAEFAQGVYLLLALLTKDAIDNSYTEGSLTSDQILTRLAQWSVNLVDYMDADGIMTPFVFHTSDPFNNPNAVSHLDANFFSGGTWSVPADHKLIWGFEKPEIALTETFAVHNRRVADTWEEELEDGASPVICEKCKRDLRCINKTCEDSAQHDQDFDQVLPPEASLFVELYRQGNPSREYFPGYSLSNGQLNLSQMSGGSTLAPVWRLAVCGRPAASGELIQGSNGVTWEESETATHDALAQFRTKPTFDFQNGGGPTPERFIWFVQDSQLPTGLSDNYFSRGEIKDGAGNTETNVYLGCNETLVIGPRSVTSFDSKPHGGTGGAASYGVAFSEVGTDETMSDDQKKTRLSLEDLQSETGCRTMIATDMNASAPIGGYGAGGTIQGTPEDKEGTELFGFGTIPCYKTVCLQRLADPTRAYDATTNPYITVDWNMIDLHVINSEENQEEDDEGKKATARSAEPELADHTVELLFSSREWGRTGMSATTGNGSDYPNLWARVILDEDTDEQAGLSGTPVNASSPGSLKITHTSLGELNEYLLASGKKTEKFSSTGGEGGGEGGESTGATFGAEYNGAPNPSFLHFPWNDAPLNTAFELMTVPACTAGRFGVEFNDNLTPDTNAKSLGSGGRFRDPASNMGPYLNFFDGSTSASDSLNLARLLEYVRVPSKFNGTIIGWADGEPIYSMREPGKININTATQAAWEALGSNTDDWPDYSDLKTARQPASTTTLDTPFRSPQAANLIADGTVRSAPDVTLLNSSFDKFQPQENDDGGTNPATALERIMRLGDLTTTRSNVFAVWITVGEFEVRKFDKADLSGTGTSEKNLWHVYSDVKGNFPSGGSGTATDADRNFFDAVYPDGYVLGKERGVDTGEVKRHRAFYLIDRSIPVGFRRGQKLNADDVILLRRILE